MTQSAVSVGQFSFFLASTNSELYLGGMNSALYSAGSTVFYPVTSQSYWLLSASANVGTTAISTLGTFSAIIDTGTSVIVVSTVSSSREEEQELTALRFAGSYRFGEEVLGCRSRLWSVRLRVLHLPVSRFLSLLVE